MQLTLPCPPEKARSREAVRDRSKKLRRALFSCAVSLDSKQISIISNSMIARSQEEENQMSTNTKSKTYISDENEREEIARFVALFEAQFQAQHKAILTSATGEVVELPAKLFEVLKQAADALASGRGVSIIPQDMKLTTQQAADFLGISRPTLIKFLEGGEINFTKVGRHRRITLRDLLVYQERARLNRRTTLRRAARAGQEAGLLDLTATDMPPRA